MSFLVWIIRTAAAGDLVRGPAEDYGGPRTGHYGTGARLAAAQGSDTGPRDLIGQNTVLTPGGGHGPLPAPGMAGAGQTSGPGRNSADQAPGSPGPLTAVSPEGDTNAAAVAAYRTSLQAGRPLSERKLAGQFGKTSRHWARNRMAEARQNLVTA